MLSSSVEGERSGAPQGVESLAVADRGPEQNQPEGLCHHQRDKDDSPNIVRRRLSDEC